MKTHFFLSPSIEEIERRLFGVSDSLIALVERGETSPRIAAAVRSSPEWQRNASAGAAAMADAELPATEAVMPAYIGDLIRRRAAAGQAGSVGTPVPGQIVQVRQIVTPRKGQLDWVMLAPLHVLLDAPAESPDLWHGWLVSGEASYASWWDVVLQEQDGDFDPEAAMVQVWNPVRVYLPMVANVAGMLSMARLQAVRAVAGEFATGEVPAGVPEWPGKVAERATLGGLAVVTGSAVRSAADPRQRYQHLYFHAAEAVKEPARLALAEAAVAIAPGLVERLREWAQRQAAVLLAPRLALAMSGTTEADDIPDLVWEGRARVRLLELSRQLATVMVSAAGTASITCRVMQDGVLLAKATVGAAGEATLSWEPGPDTELVLDDGVEQLAIPFNG